MTSAGRFARASADEARERFSLRIPNRELILVFLRETAWVTCLWFAIYGGANWLTGLHNYRVRLWTDIELKTPFVPAAAFVYLSLFPMLWLAPLVLQTEERLRSFAKTLAWLIVISGVGFILLPCEQAYPQQTANGVFGAVFHVADQLNMSYNFLPSLHVGMAVVCAYAYSQVAPLKLAGFFWLWAAAIAASTLLTHQHYVADVVAGGALGLLVAAKRVQ